MQPSRNGAPLLSARLLPSLCYSCFSFCFLRLLLSAVLVSVVSVAIETPFDPIDGDVVALDRPIVFRDLLWGGESVLRDAGASYLEVRISELCLGDDESLILYDSSGVKRESFRGCRGKIPVWSDRVEGDEVHIRLIRGVGPHVLGPRQWNKAQHEAKARIDQYVRGSSVDKNIAGGASSPSFPFTARTICGPNESEDAACYASSHRPEYSHGRATARIRVRKSSGGTSWCTGFLISRRNHLLTNRHCIADDYAADNSEYEFGSAAPECGAGTNRRGAHPGSIKLKGGATLLMTSAQKDYALLKLDASVADGATDPARTFGYLDFSPDSPSPNEPLYVPHHPDGRAREISLFSSHALDESGLCEVNVVNCCSVTYFCDTDGGSSGSPVLSRASHRVETIHSSGNSGCDYGNFGRIIGHIYEEIEDFVDECQSDDECSAAGDACSVYRCDGSPRRCRVDGVREGCCGNGICEYEDCGTCPMDCCWTYSLEMTTSDDADVDGTIMTSHGIMFDVQTVSGTAINILELWFRPHYSGYSEISVYAKPGSWIGSENNPAEWTLLGSSSVLLTAGKPVLVPSSIIGRDDPLAVPGTSHWSIYVTSSASQMELSSIVPEGISLGEEITSDGLVALLAGAGTVGHDIGSLVISSDRLGALAAGRIVYHAQPDEGGSMGRPDGGGTTIEEIPTGNPTANPSGVPTLTPTKYPISTAPTSKPTTAPTVALTLTPTRSPASTHPTSAPTHKPTAAPSLLPTLQPSFALSLPPTHQPTIAPSSSPTYQPTAAPSSSPTYQPTAAPSSSPTYQPTPVPSAALTLERTLYPTHSATPAPSGKPTASPTSSSPTKTSVPLTAAPIPAVPTFPPYPAPSSSSIASTSPTTAGPTLPPRSTPSPSQKDTSSGSDDGEGSAATDEAGAANVGDDANEEASLSASGAWRYCSSSLVGALFALIMLSQGAIN